MTVACALLAATGLASASRLSVSNRNIRWTFARYTSNNAGIEISCELTLEGSFHSNTITKVRGTLIGHMNRTSVRSGCSGGWGDMRFLNESLPWHITYQSFSGSLPSITAVTVDVIGFSWNYRGLGGGTCLYRSTTAGPARWILNREAGGLITGVRADETIAVPFAGGEITCAESINYRGLGRVSLTGTTTAIRVTLI
jgi:hypothetical protein